jgi:hypothetical protein
VLLTTGDAAAVAETARVFWPDVPPFRAVRDASGAAGDINAALE